MPSAKAKTFKHPTPTQPTINSGSVTVTTAASASGAPKPSSNTLISSTSTSTAYQGGTGSTSSGAQAFDTNSGIVGTSASATDSLSPYARDSTPQLSDLPPGTNTAGLNAQQLRSLARKERNRVAAQKSRDRKKNEFEGLEQENNGLRSEIDQLKTKVRSLESELEDYRSGRVKMPGAGNAEMDRKARSAAPRKRVKNDNTSTMTSINTSAGTSAGDGENFLASTTTTSNALASRDDSGSLSSLTSAEEEEEQEQAQEDEDNNDMLDEEDELADDVSLRQGEHQSPEDEDLGDVEDEILRVARVMGKMREGPVASLAHVATSQQRPGLVRRRSSARTGDPSSVESSLPTSPKRSRKGSGASIQGPRSLFPAIASVLRGTAQQD